MSVLIPGGQRFKTAGTQGFCVFWLGLIVLLLPLNSARADYAIAQGNEQDLLQLLKPPTSWQAEHGRLLEIGIERTSLRLKLQAAQTREEVGLLITRSEKRKSLPDTSGCFLDTTSEISVCPVTSFEVNKTIAAQWLHWAQQNGRLAKLKDLFIEVRQQNNDEKTHSIQSDELKGYPFIHPAPSQTAAPWWTPLSILGLGGMLLVLCSLPLKKDRSSLYWFWLIAAVAAASRLLLPGALMHMQNDDLVLVATARALPGWEIPSSHSMHGLLLPLFHTAFSLWGNGIDALFWLNRMCGWLLVPLTYLFAWQWSAQRRVAIAAAVFMLLSPAALAMSGAISAYLPTAACFTAALCLAIWAQQSKAIALFAIPISTAFLLLSALLKPEFLALIPAHAVIVGGFAWHKGHHRRLALLLALTPAFLSALILMNGYQAFLADLGNITRGRLGQDRVPFGLNKLSILLNPPLLPFKLLFLYGLFFRFRSRDLPLYLALLPLMALFLLATQPYGMNHWRYALLFLTPFSVALAPELVWLWERRHEKWPRVVLAILALFLVFQGYRIYLSEMFNQRNQALEIVRDYHPQPRTLALYASYGQDRDAGAYLSAAGHVDHLALTELWPSCCPADRTLENIALRNQLLDRNLCMRYKLKDHPGFALFRDDTRLLQDIQQAKSMTPPIINPDLLLYAEKQLSMATERIDMTCCSKELAVLHRRLNKYDRIVLFYDPLQQEAASDSRDPLAYFTTFLKNVRVAEGRNQAEAGIRFEAIHALISPDAPASQPPVWLEPNPAP